METKIIEISQEELATEVGKIRSMSENEWIEKHASGTLRKSKRNKLSYRNLYLRERIAFEFGWKFCLIPRSKIMFGDLFAEGDCHSLTEFNWHVDRLFARNPFPKSDIYEAKYIKIQNGKKSKEGAGVILRQTSAPFVPSGHIVYALISKFDTKKDKWKSAKNPF